jgi:hypothetical protein
MTIDEAIQLYIQRAENHEYILHSGEFIGGEGERMKQDIKRCVSENRQLAEWLTELKKAKKLLKEALIIAKIRPFCDERYCDICKNIGCEWGEDCFEWEHEDEVLALIGEDIDVPASADDTNVGRKSGGWISCKDRLPEPDTMVIVASYGSDIVIPEDGETVEECCERLKKERVRVTLGFIGSDGWYGSDYFPLIVTPSFWQQLIITPSFWQPLPGPPKGGDTE